MQLSNVGERLAGLTLRDERRIARRVAGAKRLPDGEERDRVLAEIDEDIRAAEARVAARRASVPPVSYPADLPISQRRDDLLAAMSEHQVVVVAGETGSGKSTQLPKLALEAGLGVRGMIGHTQPRRIAARTIAERVAEELGVRVGEEVGYTVRFTDRVGDNTLVKVMTDGILLSEIQRDRFLSRYDTLIIDEAHERSLNVDFILGYLKQLLPKRPDLKVIVTSATIDTERFSAHFDGAPVVEVSGRTYPVEIRYRPFDDDEDRDLMQAIGDAVEELAADGPGDVLVFLSGEREIRDAADSLGRRNLRDTELLPLFARLSSADQHRVFQPHSGRRVVLATNIAETSLTVPGIRYVVDAGTARISRYSRRTKVQRLPIEPVSQASANQRAGRCGRLGPGVCVRLYSEADFLSRPEFTEPEILRTNLASVILQMAAIGLGDISGFPFVDPPDVRSIRDGIAVLEEVGALAPGAQSTARRLTPVGRTLAQLPLDPRLARVVLAGHEEGCLHEAMVIASVVSIQDPREQPAGKEDEARGHHSRFADPHSDFVAYLRLWEHLQSEQRSRSSSQFRKLCKAEYLNYLRVREWQDIYTQLRQVTRSLGWRANRDPAPTERLHAAVVTGFLSHVGMRHPERREYRGARDVRFALVPTSSLAKRPPKWVVVAELVETNRMWGRDAARVQPEWVEKAGAHLVKRSYTEPWWDERRGAALVNERVTLYGLPLVAARPVHLGRLDPALAREMFIRHALVERTPDRGYEFLERNEEVVRDVEEIASRARRTDLLVDDSARLAFYDARIPADVTSLAQFERWWKEARRRSPDLLTMSPGDLLSGLAQPDRDAYPGVWVQDDVELPLTYLFAPGDPFDGVTAHIPLSLLGRIRNEGFDWHVPAYRRDLVLALIRSLPKPVRRAFVPAPDYAHAVLDNVAPVDGPLLDVMAAELRRHTGEAVRADAFDTAALDPHLRVHFAVEDEQGQVVAAGDDLEALKSQLARRTRASVARAVPTIERSGLTAWDFGELPRVVEVESGGHLVQGFPALVDERDTVGVRVFADSREQERAMKAGTRRLVLLQIPSPKRALRRLIPRDAALAMAQLPNMSTESVVDDCVVAATDAAIDRCGGPAWDRASFDALVDCVREGIVDVAEAAAVRASQLIARAASVDARLAAMTAPALQPAVLDVTMQLARLIFPGFVTYAGIHRLADIERYLEAIDRRLEKLRSAPGRDAELMERVNRLEDDLAKVSAGASPEDVEGVERVRWLLEELRVSFFAQSVRTSEPVSEKRVRRELEAIAGRI